MTDQLSFLPDAAADAEVSGDLSHWAQRCDYQAAEWFVGFLLLCGGVVPQICPEGLPIDLIGFTPAGASVRVQVKSAFGVSNKAKSSGYVFGKNGRDDNQGLLAYNTEMVDMLAFVARDRWQAIFQMTEDIKTKTVTLQPSDFTAEKTRMSLEHCLVRIERRHLERCEALELWPEMLEEWDKQHEARVAEVEWSHEILDKKSAIIEKLLAERRS